jgi:hypothetical protein
MDSTTTSAAESRRAHRRVGAAAVLAFVALLALGLARNAAQADPATPAIAPAETAAPAPEQAVPGGSAPFIPHRYRYGGGPRDGGGEGPGFGGGTTPAPDPGAITS